MAPLPTFIFLLLATRRPISFVALGLACWVFVALWNAAVAL